MYTLDQCRHDRGELRATVRILRRKVESLEVRVADDEALIRGLRSELGVLRATVNTDEDDEVLEAFDEGMRRLLLWTGVAKVFVLFAAALAVVLVIYRSVL
jgi:RecG-like helicase